MTEKCMHVITFYKYAHDCFYTHTTHSLIFNPSKRSTLRICSSAKIKFSACCRHAEDEVGGEDLVCDASCSHISHSSPTTVV